MSAIKKAAAPVAAEPVAPGPPADLKLELLAETPITVNREHEVVRMVADSTYATYRGDDGSTWEKTTIGKKVTWARMYPAPGVPTDPEPPGELP